MYELMIIFIILVVLLIGKILSNHWSNPAYLFTVYWSIFIIAALIAFRNYYEWDYISLLWIIFSCILFGGGHALGYSFSVRNYLDKDGLDSGKSVSKVLSKISWKFILLCIIIGLLRTIFEVFKNGFSLEVFYNFNSLLDMNADMATQRYLGGGGAQSPLMQLMLISVYVAPLCGGYAFVYAENKMKRIMCLLTFVPIISDVLITNAKAGFIAAIFLWLSGFLVAYLELHKKSPQIKIGMAIKIIMIGIAIFSLLYFSMLLRIGDLSASTREVVSSKFITYALGHMPAFDYWFAHHAMDSNYSFGKYTFIGLLESIGFSIREQGLFTDVVHVANGMYTNVFTVFRGIILDYGIIGGLLFFLIFGMISGYVYKNVLSKRKNKVFAKVALASIYFFIMHSIFSSAWTYVSYILIFPAFFIYLWLADPKAKGPTEDLKS
ncbi:MULTISPECIES: O-antigen polymerase [Bacillus]|uniref:O-antigen polymerase n=1 Tax=Bacillus TaxID=1386 RepID=UPI00148F1849|nr:O-antigen polymerase [Bacillus paranthracis]NOP80692.1 oligosaccharide repeat unit polymerase [Bacillus paranthracis]